MRLTNIRHRTPKRGERGFTLTEMLVTMLIMVLASTLMATGIPAAVDTYKKTVNSANAQMALSTTLTVLRSEYGASTRLVAGDTKTYYLSDEDVFAAIENPSESETYRGLVKRYYLNTGSEASPVFAPFREGGEALSYPIISDATITEPLHVTVGSIEWRNGEVVVHELQVVDEATPPNTLAQIDEYRIPVPFVD